VPSGVEYGEVTPLPILHPTRHRPTFCARNVSPPKTKFQPDLGVWCIVEHCGRSWSWFLGSHPAVVSVINTAVGWCYFPPAGSYFPALECHRRLATTRLYCVWQAQLWTICPESPRVSGTSMSCTHNLSVRNSLTVSVHRAPLTLCYTVDQVEWFIQTVFPAHIYQYINNTVEKWLFWISRGKVATVYR